MGLACAVGLNSCLRLQFVGKRHRRMGTSQNLIPSKIQAYKSIAYKSGFNII
jgi:hypothetical protein